MKHHAVRGRKYKSKLEARVAKRLHGMRFKVSYEKLKLPYVLEKEYNPDFEIDGGIILEVKGVLDQQSRVKMAAVKAQYPDLDIRFIFAKPHSRCPGLKMSHAQWAEKYGYPWYGELDFKSKDLK